MQSYYRFRWRRQWRTWRRSAKWLRRQATFIVRTYIFNRTKRLRWVQRFIFSTVAIFAIAIIGLRWQLGELKQYYLTEVGRSGGTFIEGAVGPLTRINPLFPDEPAAEVVSKLVFNGLLRYDGNGKLEGDLARSWSQNELGTSYSVNLRPHLRWQDGRKLTAKDVVFTIKTIQNPDVRSPLAASWKGIEVSAVNAQTVRFELSAPYSPFANSLTQPILPKHLLQGINPAQLRLADFNQHPVGSGPFIFEEFIPTQQTVRLRANPTYVHGAPRLRRFILRTYENQEALQAAFADHQLTAASGFGVFDAKAYEEVKHARLLQPSTTSQAFAFFNTSKPALSSVKTRQALTRATKPAAAAAEFDYRFHTTNAALLPEQLNYNQDMEQLGFDIKQAKKQLRQAGWRVGKDGWRYKKGKRLWLELVTQNRDIYPTLAQSLQQQWQKVGAELKIRLVTSTELSERFIQPRAYDVLLFGIMLGADPDVYSYWHSSQIKHPGLNLSVYKSDAVDVALATGRSRMNPRMRAEKYRDFLLQWRQDAPAIALYRPDFLYAVQERAKGIDIKNLITPADRFYNVEDWTVNTGLVPKP